MSIMSSMEASGRQEARVLADKDTAYNVSDKSVDPTPQEQSKNPKFPGTYRPPWRGRLAWCIHMAYTCRL